MKYIPYNAIISIKYDYQSDLKPPKFSTLENWSGVALTDWIERHSSGVPGLRVKIWVDGSYWGQYRSLPQTWDFPA